MASRHEIKYATKRATGEAHERITHVGGVIAAQRWKVSQGDAIRGIRSGQWAFFVARGGHQVEVRVVLSRTGHPYLRTAADGEASNNLLSLPKCPW